MKNTQNTLLQKAKSHQNTFHTCKSQIHQSHYAQFTSQIYNIAHIKLQAFALNFSQIQPKCLFGLNLPTKDDYAKTHSHSTLRPFLAR